MSYAFKTKAPGSPRKATRGPKNEIDINQPKAIAIWAIGQASVDSSFAAFRTQFRVP